MRVGRQARQEVGPACCRGLTLPNKWLRGYRVVIVCYGQCRHGWPELHLLTLPTLDILLDNTQVLCIPRYFVAF